MGPADFDDDFDDIGPDTYRSLPPSSARAWRHPAETAFIPARNQLWRAPAVLLLGSLIVGVAATSAVWFALAPAGTPLATRPFDQVAVLADRTPRVETPTVAEVPLVRVERPGSTAMGSTAMGSTVTGSTATGSSFTIAALAVRDGILATAADLIAGSTRLTLVGDEREVALVATDSANNIAFLSTARTGRVPLMTSDYAPSIGEQLVAIAGPGTVWLSTVTAFDQSANAGGDTVAFRVSGASRIQLGASLLDTSGRTVGLVVRADGNGGWAVPSRYLQAMAARSTDAPGGWPTAGLSVHQSDSYVYVASVIPAGPADSAGLLPDDTIVEVGSQRITTMAGFFTSIMEAGTGRDLTIAYMRDGIPHTSTLVVARRNESTPAAAP